MELTVGHADFGDRYVATVTWRPLRGDRYVATVTRISACPRRERPWGRFRRMAASRVGLEGRYVATVTWPPGLGAVRAVSADARVAGGPREWASLWPLAWCRSQADLCTCRGSAFRRRRGHQRRRERFLIWASRALPYLGVESASLFGRRDRFFTAAPDGVAESARLRGRESDTAWGREHGGVLTQRSVSLLVETNSSKSGRSEFPSLGRQSGTKREDRDARLADTSTGQKARPAHVTCGLPSGRGPRP
jgi:hypothetical protein